MLDTPHSVTAAPAGRCHTDRFAPGHCSVCVCWPGELHSPAGRLGRRCRGCCPVCTPRSTRVRTPVVEDTRGRPLRPPLASNRGAEVELL